MSFFVFHGRCVRVLILFAIAPFVLATSAGCGGGGGLDATEAEVQSTVEGLNGTTVVEDGHIVAIDLGNSEVEDSHLKQFEQLPALKKLNLQGTAVTDAVFPTADNIPTLEELDISGAKVTRKKAQLYRNAHPNLMVSGPEA